MGLGDGFFELTAELLALSPDIILAANGAATVVPLLQASRTVPIVFVKGSTRSAVASSQAWQSRAAMPPGSPNFEYTLSGKWLQLLKELAPGSTRAAVLRETGIASGSANGREYRRWRHRWQWS